MRVFGAQVYGMTLAFPGGAKKAETLDLDTLIDRLFVVSHERKDFVLTKDMKMIFKSHRIPPLVWRKRLLEMGAVFELVHTRS